MVHDGEGNARRMNQLESRLLQANLRSIELEKQITKAVIQLQKMSFERKSTLLKKRAKTAQSHLKADELTYFQQMEVFTFHSSSNTYSFLRNSIPVRGTFKQ